MKMLISFLALIAFALKCLALPEETIALLAKAEIGDRKSIILVLNKIHEYKNNKDFENLYILANKAQHIKGISETADMELGLCYLDGSGTKKNEIAGIKYLESAAEKGNTYAMEKLLQLYSQTAYKNESQKSFWLKKLKDAAKAGDLSAWFMLYDYYTLVHKDKIAAEECYVYKIDSLIDFYFRTYLEGIHVKYIDFEKIKNYAIEGYPKAQYLLSWIYRDGKITEKDNAKALYWVQVAAGEREKIADHTISANKESQPDPRKYLPPLPDAQHALYYSYKEGDLVDKNYDKALKMLTKAAQSKDPRYDVTQFKRELGREYLLNKITPRNIPLAQKYLNEAAANNDAEAYFLLGQIEHFNNNLPLALLYYQKSNELGFELGKKVVNDLIAEINGHINISKNLNQNPVYNNSHDISDALNGIKTELQFMNLRD